MPSLYLFAALDLFSDLDPFTMLVAVIGCVCFIIIIVVNTVQVVRYVRNDKAKRILRDYKEGVWSVMHISWIFSYDDAKKILLNKKKIVSAQKIYQRAKELRMCYPNACSDYDDNYIVNNESKIRAAQEIYLKASEIRKSCPDSCSGKDDNYIVNNEVEIRSAQKKYLKVCELKEAYPEDCAGKSDEYIAENADAIVAEKANYYKLMPQLQEFKKAYPLAIHDVAKEKGLSLDTLEGVLRILELSEELSSRQEHQERAVLSDKNKFDALTENTRECSRRLGRHIAKKRNIRAYGSSVAKAIEDRIDADDHFDSIAKKQGEFAAETRNLFPEVLGSWGCYKYAFKFESKDGQGHSKTSDLTVWQPFYNSCCFNDTISYEHYPRLKENRIKKDHIEQGYTYTEPVWAKVMSFIEKVHSKYGSQVHVIFANTDRLSESSFEKNFRCIREKLDEACIGYSVDMPQDISRSLDMKFIIIDMITENQNLISYCEEIFKLRYGSAIETDSGSTCIVYVTLMKCYDGDEVEQLNRKAIKAKEEERRRAQEEEERRKLEEAQKLKDESDMSLARDIAHGNPQGYKHYFAGLSTMSMSVADARRIIQMEASIRDYESMLVRVREDVAGWNTVHEVPHYFFYYYYPTNKFSYQDLSQDSIWCRELVYDFKDGRDHNEVKDLVSQKLVETFGREDLAHMTFVCIPASTRSVNATRYEAFSREVCQNLNMGNGYEHITITKEKTPSHLGGTDSAEFDFDGLFFKDRLVVLFDDIVTRGRSISSVKSSLEAVGASVVCAMSIGRTFSDWGGQTPQPHPHTGRI